MLSRILATGVLVLGAGVAAKVVFGRLFSRRRSRPATRTHLHSEFDFTAEQYAMLALIRQQMDANSPASEEAASAPLISGSASHVPTPEGVRKKADKSRHFSWMPGKQVSAARSSVLSHQAQAPIPRQGRDLPRKPSFSKLPLFLCVRSCRFGRPADPRPARRLPEETHQRKTGKKAFKTLKIRLVTLGKLSNSRHFLNEESST